MSQGTLQPWVVWLCSPESQRGCTSQSPGQDFKPPMPRPYSKWLKPRSMGLASVCKLPGDHRVQGRRRCSLPRDDRRRTDDRIGTHRDRSGTHVTGQDPNPSTHTRPTRPSLCTHNRPTQHFPAGRRSSVCKTQTGYKSPLKDEKIEHGSPVWT